MLKRLLNYLIDNYFSFLLSEQEYKNRYSISCQSFQMRKDYLKFLDDIYNGYKIGNKEYYHFDIANDRFTYYYKQKQFKTFVMSNLIDLAFIERLYIENYKENNTNDSVEKSILKLKESIKSDEELLEEIKQMRNK